MNEQEKLFELLEAAASPFGSVAESERRLKEADFEGLDYGKVWNIRKGGKYVVNHHGTCLFAFTVGEEFAPGQMIRLAAAHTDHPCFRIKPNADFVTNVYAQVNVEVYGGPILNTWLDRPLGVAGRVVVRGKDAFQPEIKLYRSSKPVFTIPNLAIHMNRDVNKGVELNKQTELMPIMDLLTEEQKKVSYFLEFIAKELQVAKEDILDFELNLFCDEKPQYIGVEDTLISAPRLDNQTSVSGLVSAMIEGTRKEGLNVIALFDHEEIGNRSKQGAASLQLRDLVIRVLKNLGETEEEVASDIYNGMLLSVDVAHGMHPNYQGKMDITNKPVLGKGFCIKQACSQSYATDAETIAILAALCDEKRIPYQRFVNRSDVVGGGTLGGVASTLLPIKTVDIGIPLLAMHSARELMGASDMDSLKDAVTAFFAY